MLKIELRDFLKWAFAEELAHHPQHGQQLSEIGSYGSAWGGVAAMAMLGCFVDGSSTPAHQRASRRIDPDAVTASEAVMLLAVEKLDVPKGWSPFPDLDDPYGLISATVTEVLERRALTEASDRNANLVGLIIASAVIGKEPEWRVEQPKFRHVMRGGRQAWFVRETSKDALGRVYEFEADGYDRKVGRPKPGAYRKMEMSDPFQSAVQARIDWHLWTLAMERLERRLKTGLISHQILPFAAIRDPWRFSKVSDDTAQALEIASK